MATQATTALNPNAPDPISIPVKSAWERYCISSEVRPEIQQDLLEVLNNTKIVILCDDSGSMNDRRASREPLNGAQPIELVDGIADRCPGDSTTRRNGQHKGGGYPLHE